jgi:hypothetical protein
MENAFGYLKIKPSNKIEELQFAYFTSFVTSCTCMGFSLLPSLEHLPSD